MESLPAPEITPKPPAAVRLSLFSYLGRWVGYALPVCGSIAAVQWHDLTRPRVGSGNDLNDFDFWLLILATPFIIAGVFGIPAYCASRLIYRYGGRFGIAMTRDGYDEES